MGRIKLSISTIMLIIFFVVYNKFFYLINISGRYGISVNQELAAVMAIILFFAFTKGKINLSGYYYKNHIIFFVLFVIFEIIVSIITYPQQPYSTTLHEGLPYMLLLIYFPLVKYLNSEKRLKDLIFIITVCSLITSVIMIFQAYLYNTTGTILLEGVSNGNISISSLRGDEVRIYTVVEGFVRMSILFSTWRLFIQSSSGRDSIITKLLYVMNTIIGMFAIYYVDKSRVYLLTLFICTLVIFLLSPVKRSWKKWVLISFLIIVCIIFLKTVISDTVSSFLSTLTDSSDSSNHARVEASIYYFKIALERPFFGIGLLTSYEINVYSGLIVGPYRYFHFDDVGLFGILGHFGFIGFFWYIALIIKLLKMIYSQQNRNIIAINLSLVLCMFVSSFTLSYLDPQRLIAIPLSLAISEYAYRNS